MRAGSLSDPRVVALLRKYFVCVHMPVLSTRDLIEDEKDAVLLERYSKANDDTFRGGEREAFFTPDGTLVGLFLGLNTGSKQYSRAGRAAPDGAVAKFFELAGAAYRKTRGALPKDWAALRAGDASEVAAARAATASIDAAPPDGRLRLRVALRHDWIMYEDLAGWEHVDFAHRELTPPTEAGASRTWPAPLVRRLARRLHPRGGGVLIALKDASITGALVTHTTTVTAGELRGTIAGTFRLEPSSELERGRRDTYRPFLWSRGSLRGDFVWDRKAARFTSLRIVSDDAEVKSTWRNYGDRGVHRCVVGIEALR